MSDHSAISSPTNPILPDDPIIHTSSGELQNLHASYRLNGKNHLKWSQLVRTLLKGIGKLSHLLGTKLKSDDPKCAAWDGQNSMVMAWLWNAMELEMSDTYMFLSTTKEIWETIQQTNSKKNDLARIYEIKIKLMAAKQANFSVTEYTNVLKRRMKSVGPIRFTVLILCCPIVPP